MGDLIEFDDLNQLEALLRAGIAFKFDAANEDEALAGSPFLSDALDRILNGLVEGCRERGDGAKADKYSSWYTLSRHVHRWDFVARRASRYPGWVDLSALDRRRIVTQIAAPFTVDDSTYARIEEMTSLV